MEHRWGMRRTLDVGVTLYVESKSPEAGRLLSASSSGAYIATSAALPIMSRVHVALGWGRTPHGGHYRVPAYVVRADDRGVGIEWQEFAPVPVLALLIQPPQQPVRLCSAVIDVLRNTTYGPAHSGRGSFRVRYKAGAPS